MVEQQESGFVRRVNIASGQDPIVNKAEDTADAAAKLFRLARTKWAEGDRVAAVVAGVGAFGTRLIAQYIHGRRASE